MNTFTRSILAAAITALGVGVTHVASADPLTIYTALEDDEVSDYMAVAKKAMPDVEFHVLRLSTGDLAARMLAEGKNPRNDVIWGFAVTNMLDPRIHDSLQSYLPPAAGQLPDLYKAKDGKWFAATGYMAAFCVNTERLKSKNLPMPTSWEDLTKPIYKGEVVMPSPAASGTGYLQIAAILQGMEGDKGWDLIKRLNPNIAQYTSSGSKPCKMARTGEYTIGASFAFPAMQSIEAGFPVQMVIPSDWEGYELEASGIMGTTKNLKDAKRFLDWTLSPEAAELYKKYKEIITIPGLKPSEQSLKAGLPADVSKVLFPINFEQSAKDRDQIIKTWQQVTAK